MKLREKIGRPIRIDDEMSMVTTWLFARLFVEVDLSKPSLSKFKPRASESERLNTKEYTWFILNADFMVRERKDAQH